MPWPATAYSNNINAVAGLRNKLIEAGYTPAAGLSAHGWLYAAMANMIDNYPLLAGTVTAPSLSRSSDTNTGIYFSAADTLDFTCGGVRALQLSTATTGVNYLDVAPAAAAASPIIRAEGTDTNIDIVLTPK